ncbi:hypothetical protein ANAPRD1_00796 [Anaplasma phagocytophilum]|nr:hypothetical protein ANAPRD1_00796 [Anaplasma phagocytophilum]
MEFGSSQYGEKLLSRDWKYLDRDCIVDVAGDDSGINVAAAYGFTKIMFHLIQAIYLKRRNYLSVS